ncbi:MAG: DUF5722 domain-containing protein, partial [Planctomycetota bacterium]
MPIRFCVFLFTILICRAGTAIDGIPSPDGIPCSIELMGEVDPKRVSQSDGVLDVRGTSVVRVVPESPPGSGRWVIEWEYFCAGGVDELRIASVGRRESKAHVIPPLGHRETFSPYQALLATSTTSAEDPEMRLEIEMGPKSVLQIRNVRIRRARPDDMGGRQDSTLRTSASDVLQDYLSRRYRSRVDRVEVDDNTIAIAGHVSAHDDKVWLAAVPMERRTTDDSRFRFVVPLDPHENGEFELTVPRFAEQTGRRVDRLTSRWQLFIRNDFADQSISHARYADSVVCRAPDLPEMKLASKKGLGGWRHDRAAALRDELSELGVSAVTVNVASLHRYVSTVAKPGFVPFDWQGQTYYANESQLRKLDQTFLAAQRDEVMVSAILLIANPLSRSDDDAIRLAHPDVERDGKFAMPAVTSSEGIHYYGAILDLMARRWSREDGVHGRVHHWIVHNEIDFGRVWTNAGKKSDVQYMDLYQRSLRLVDLIVRQYDPHARAWVSLTHHCAQPGTKDGYGSKRMLDLLAQFCREEGNFPWALAYHPYPQSLV